MMQSIPYHYLEIFEEFWTVLNDINVLEYKVENIYFIILLCASNVKATKSGEIDYIIQRKLFWIIGLFDT